MPNKKKKYSARFPPARIKKIMQKDDEVGKVAAAVPVIISRSLELFVESLIKKTNNLVVSRNARTLTPQHIKQTVLIESEFRFLHDLVSSIPDVQSTEDEQQQQPLLQEVAVAKPPTETATINAAASSSTSSSGKVGGKQRGRPRKLKPEEGRQIKEKKARLAANTEDHDSEETCSGSEEENKDHADQSKLAHKTVLGQKLTINKITHYLPNIPPPGSLVPPSTLPNPVIFGPPIVPGPSSCVPPAFPAAAAPTTSSNVADAYVTLNGGEGASVTRKQSAEESLVGGAQSDEALDLSTTSGKNGAMGPLDMKVKVEEDPLRGATFESGVPRTFYVTSILNANVQSFGDATGKPPQEIEAYKLNIPKISVQMAVPAPMKPDLTFPSDSTAGCTLSHLQPIQNYLHAASSAGAAPILTYQVQNFAQNVNPPSRLQQLPPQSTAGGHSTNVILSPVGVEAKQNPTSEGQFVDAASPVHLFQYPGFVSLMPGAAYAGVKSTDSCRVEPNLLTFGGNVTLGGKQADDDTKLNPSNKDSLNDS